MTINDLIKIIGFSLWMLGMNDLFTWTGMICTVAGIGLSIFSWQVEIEAMRRAMKIIASNAKGADNDR